LCCAGEFVWYVHNWNKLKNIETNEPICSEVWEAGGHKWQMKMYPGGLQLYAVECLLSYAVIWERLAQHNNSA